MEMTPTKSQVHALAASLLKGISSDVPSTCELAAWFQPAPVNAIIMLYFKKLKQVQVGSVKKKKKKATITISLHFLGLIINEIISLTSNFVMSLSIYPDLKFRNVTSNLHHSNCNLSLFCTL